MVAKELLEELRGIRRDFDWKFDGNSGKIRANLKSQPGNVFDPIGAVCFARTGSVHPEQEWYEAAEELGLSHIDAGDLTAAANNVSRTTGQPNTDNLRRQMIDTLRLEAKASASKRSMIMGYFSTLFGTHPKSDLTSSRAK
jgi:hypothetical protein